MRERSDESDLPSLQSIQLGNNALQGDSGDKRKMIVEPPYNYRNTMTMRSGISRLCMNRPSFTNVLQRRTIQFPEHWIDHSREY